MASKVWLDEMVIMYVIALFAGGYQDNWTTLSETQKMVKAILLKAQCEAELNATLQPFQKK